MVPGVHQVADSVYLANGYAFTSPAVIVGDNGIIIIDLPGDANKGRITLEASPRVILTLREADAWKGHGSTGY